MTPAQIIKALLEDEDDDILDATDMLPDESFAERWMAANLPKYGFEKQQSTFTKGTQWIASWYKDSAVVVYANLADPNTLDYRVSRADNNGNWWYYDIPHAPLVPGETAIAKLKNLAAPRYAF